MKILISSFNQTFKTMPFVFKKITVYFGIYFIVLVIIALFVLDNVLPFSLLEENTETTIGLTTAVFNLFCHTFTVFMIPYYAYKYDNKVMGVKPFWTFIGETVWPVVINQIKALFVILLYCLLLIIPGIYKSIRFSFLTQTVFFDDMYKQGGKSALKTTQNMTQGYFWLIVLLVILNTALVFVLAGVVGPMILELLSTQSSFIPQVIMLSFWFFFNFFMYAFIVLFKNQFYFVIKEHRAEAISL